MTSIAPGLPSADDDASAGMAALQAGGRLDAAFAAFHRALSLRPDHPAAILGVAVACRGRGDWARSAAWCRIALRLQPDRAEARVHLARALAAQGNRAGAAAQFAVAACCAPDAPDVWMHRTALGLTDSDAEIFLTRAVALDPAAAEPRLRRHGLSCCSDRGDDIVAVVIAPDSCPALIRHARTLSRGRTGGRAEAFIARAIRLQPNNPDGRLTAADLARDENHAVEHAAHVLTITATPTHRSAAVRLIAARFTDGAPNFNTLSSLPGGRVAARILAENTAAVAESALQPFLFAMEQAGDDPGFAIVGALLWARLARNLPTDGDVHLPPALSARIVEWMGSPELSAEARSDILIAMDYTPSSSRSRNEAIFSDIVLPALSAALSRLEWDLIRLLMTYTQWSILVQPHSQEQAERCYDRFAAMFRRAGERVRADAPQIDEESAVGTVFLVGEFESDPPFHLDLALRTVFSQDIPARGRIDPVSIFTLGRASERFRADYRALGVEVAAPADCPPCDGGSDNALGRLIDWTRRKRPQTVIFFNLLEGVADMLAVARLAPTQIYLSPEFHHVASPELDGRVTFGSPVKATRRILGRKWCGAPFPLTDTQFSPDLPSADLSAAADAIRHGQFGRFSVVLGSIGRPEKLSPAFLDSLARILHAHQDACFLWFGRRESADIRRGMVERGVSERCFFVGWVDTRLYARVLDIHLQSFPFPGGLTLMDSMHAARAFVLMDSHEASQLSISGYTCPLLDGELGTDEEQALVRRIFTGPDGENLHPFARNADDFVALARRMIVDPAFRKAVGRAGHDFLTSFLFDNRRAAEALFGHIADITDTRLKSLSS
jgi:tetratricopeptide (TPR) repeat protein